MPQRLIVGLHCDDKSFVVVPDSTWVQNTTLSASEMNMREGANEICAIRSEFRKAIGKFLRCSTEGISFNDLYRELEWVLTHSDIKEVYSDPK